MSMEHPAGLTMDQKKGIYLTGSFEDEAYFGMTKLKSKGKLDVFVAKISSTGSFQWATQAGSSADDSGMGIGVDSSGNAYVSGAVGGVATFGTSTLTAKGTSDLFVAKLDTTGNFLWTILAPGTSGSKAGASLVTDSVGTSTLAGNLVGEVTLGGTKLTASGSNDILLAQVSAAGKFLWAAKAGGTSKDLAEGALVIALRIPTSNHTCC